ncbi:MAG TPA: AAA family ATPase, partial [Gemmatimonadales bacterium]|nr:AAA family ATPase [Gemmatimonadales bacterium]
MRLHGRTGELDTLVHHLELAASGRAQLALLEGEAGMGKTRLVDETMTLARKRGFQVFHGRVEELERTRPFGAFADALHCHRRSKDPARAAVGGLLTGEIGDGLGAPASQFRVIDAFVELCERLTTGGPVLLALEDLHWADPTTLLTVRATVRQLAQAPVMLVGTYRPTPQRPEMARLVEVSAEEGACLLRLMPLPREAVIALVTECAGAVPGPRLCGQLDRTGGSPLYALELIKSLDEQAALQRVDGQVEAEETELPATLRLTILRRLRGLPEATVELLRLASILGSALSLTDLSRLAKRPAVELLPAVREARAAGVLGESGGQLAFRHDLVREAIYTDLPLPVRQALHHDFGQALAAAGGPPVRVATHLALGATVGDDQAVRWLRQAAREAGPRAP